MKKIAIVPTLLTLGNGICGFVAITFASKVWPTVELNELKDNAFHFACAGWFILLAMVFDMLDGYVARLTKTASKFGGELDSLCDAISFGVAPAFLLLKMGPGWDRPLPHQLLVGIAALYMVCAVLRLARFNVDNTPDPAAHRRFRGLPSPGAAGCLAALAIVLGHLPGRLSEMWPDANPEVLRAAVYRAVEIFCPIGGLIAALLMVSLVPYPHVTKQIFSNRKHVGHLVQVLLGILFIVIFRELALGLIFWGYALGMPLHYLLMRKLRREETPTPDALPR